MEFLALGKHVLAPHLQGFGVIQSNITDANDSTVGIVRERILESR
jgi:hypothetical protein